MGNGNAYASISNGGNKIKPMPLGPQEGRNSGLICCMKQSHYYLGTRSHTENINPSKKDGKGVIKEGTGSVFSGHMKFPYNLIA